MRMLTPHELQFIRRQLAHGLKLDRMLETYDMFPASSWNVYLFAPHGDERIYLTMFDDESEKRAAVMEINQAFVTEIARTFNSAKLARSLMRRGSISAATDG